MKRTNGREVRGYCSNKGEKWACPEPSQQEEKGESESLLERMKSTVWLGTGYGVGREAKGDSTSGLDDLTEVDMD